MYWTRGKWIRLQKINLLTVEGVLYAAIPTTRFYRVTRKIEMYESGASYAPGIFKPQKKTAPKN